MAIKLSRRNLFLGGGATVIGSVLLNSSPSYAQLGGLKGLGGLLGNNVPEIAGRFGSGVSLSSLLNGQPPITTSLKDAKYGVTDMDSFVIPKTKQSLKALRRGNNGSFILEKAIIVIIVNPIVSMLALMDQVVAMRIYMRQLWGLR